jgi:hypothetical protein
MTEKRLLITWIGNIVGILVTPLFVIWSDPAWPQYAHLQALVLGAGIIGAVPAIYFIIKFRALVAASNGSEDSLFDINQALSLWGMAAFIPCLLGVAHYMLTGTYVVLVALTVLSAVLTLLFKPTK